MLRLKFPFSISLQLFRVVHCVAHPCPASTLTRKAEAEEDKSTKVHEGEEEEKDEAAWGMRVGNHSQQA